MYVARRRERTPSIWRYLFCTEENADFERSSKYVKLMRTKSGYPIRWLCRRMENTNKALRFECSHEMDITDDLVEGRFSYSFK